MWDPEKARAVEPYVATPLRRMRIVRAMADAGIPVSVNVAPIIPGLGDEEIPRILTAARDAGATSAGYVLLRLPGPVAEVFESRMRAAMPLRVERILHRIRETRGGKMYDPRFGVRGQGEGEYAAMIRNLFVSTATRLGLRVGCLSMERHQSPPDRSASATTVVEPGRQVSSTPALLCPTGRFNRRFDRRFDQIAQRCGRQVRNAER